MDYFGIFTKTLKQWWKHKYLWIVGILGSILAGGGSTGNLYNLPNNTNNTNNSFQNLNWLKEPAIVTSIIVIAIVIFMLGLVFFALSLYLQARADSALFQTTVKIQGEASALGFWKSWSLGKFRLKTLVAQQLLIGAPIYILGIILAVALIVILITVGNNQAALRSSFFILFGCFALFACLAGIYAIVAGLASLFGKRISVLEDIGAIEALKRGLKFFGDHFSDIVVFWLVSLIAGFITSAISFPLILLLGFFALVFIVPMIIINPILGVVIALVLLVVFVVLMVLFEGPIYAFNQMYWTNVYLEIKKAKS